MSMEMEPDGFIAYTPKYCNCPRCKSFVKDCVPLQCIQNCSHCSKRYAYLLKTNITNQQLCSNCYIIVVGFEQANQISKRYPWMHPAEYEFWGVPADEIGFIVPDASGTNFFVPMAEASKDIIAICTLTYRPLNGGGRANLQQAKILCNPADLEMTHKTLEDNIDWDNPMDEPMDAATTIAENGNGHSTLERATPTLKDKLVGLFK